MADSPYRSLRLGIAGGGAIADVYLRAIAGKGWAHITALADTDPGVRERRSAAGMTIYADASELLADASVDVVVIALPHDLHAAMSIAAMCAGKDVICEKPLALTVEDAEAVAAAEQATGRRVVVRTYLRALDHHRWLGAALAAGDLGTALLFRGLFASDRRSALKDLDDWHGDWSRAGGGVVIDSGYHLVDLARHLLGEVETVDAQMQRSVAHRSGAAEDIAQLTMRHRGGAVSSLSCVWNDNLAPFRWERELYASEGVAHVHDHSSESRLLAQRRGAERTERVVGDWWRTANAQAIHDCVRALTTEDNTDGGAVDVADAAATLRVVLAGYRSAAVGTRCAPRAVPRVYRASSDSIAAPAR